MSGGGDDTAVRCDRRPTWRLVVEEPGRAAVRPVAATEGPVAVRTRFSGLSAGTELSFLTGTNPALHSSFDPELGLFRTDRPGRGLPGGAAGLHGGRGGRSRRPTTWAAAAATPSR